jgi:putative ABC transport system permease protein
LFSKLSQLWRRLLFYLRREQFDRDLEEEMQLHLEMKAEENLAAGTSPEEARYAAQRQFGNQTLLREVSRDMWSFRHLETLAQDLRYGLRMMIKNPGFTAVAVLTLALGIGVNTALFSVVNAILLRPLPYPESSDLAQVWESTPKNDRSNFSLANFLDYRDQQTGFEQMAAYFRRDANLIFAGEPERVQGAVVSANFLQLLRVRPILGRGFLTEEETPGKHRVAILSYGLWQRRFGADPHIINKPVTLGSAVFTVVGVLPSHFQFPDPFGANPLSDTAPKFDLLTPLAYDQKNLGDRGSHFMQVIARLKPGVGLTQAQAELRAIASRLEQQYPDRNKGWTVNVFALHDEVARAIRPTLLLLLAAVGFVLLIACVNVSNLLLARAASRRKEMAIRLALGAPRARLLRQLLTESLLLALSGAAAGLALAYWAVRAFIAFSPANVPRTNEIRLDGLTLLFTFGVTALASIGFGLLPALQSSKPDVHDAIKDGWRKMGAGTGRQRTRGLLVVVEVALSLLLLIGAGLMIRTFISFQRVNPGFRTNNLLTMGVALPASKYRERQQWSTFFQQATERIRALPGVQSVGAVCDLPWRGESDVLGFIIEGRPTALIADDQSAAWHAINPDYFRTMGMQLLRGREFTERDLPGAPEPVIVNETLARRFWPGEDPIGKRIQIYDGEPMPWRQIVGVVSDVKQFGVHNDVKQPGLSAPAIPAIYVPFPQRPWARMTLIAHTTGQPEQLVSAMRAAVQSVDKEQAVYRVRTMEQYFSDAVAAPRATMFLLGALAVAALQLAAVGIYGVMAYAVSERTHEIGIRLALGARVADVLRLIIRQGMGLVLAGVGIGLAGALIATRLMKTLLFGVSATDPLTFTAITLLLAFVALLACWIPARRAAKVDPMTALRFE